MQDPRDQLNDALADPTLTPTDLAQIAHVYRTKLPQVYAVADHPAANSFVWLSVFTLHWTSQTIPIQLITPDQAPPASHHRLLCQLVARSVRSALTPAQCAALGAQIDAYTPDAAHLAYDLLADATASARRIHPSAAMRLLDVTTMLATT